MELEGLRGLAAAAVVLGHFLFLFFPALRDGDMSLAHTRFEDNVYGSPLTILFAATFAVAIFFVLSGFVLSVGFFQSGEESIVKRLATDRYLRLMLPALASVMIAWLLISLGAGSLTSEAGELANSSGLAMKWRKSPGFLESIKTGTYDIFVQYRGASRAINHALWTMYVEFIGSFIVFGFLLVFAKSRHRWIAYSILSIATLGTWFLGFVLGMAIADAYSQGWLQRLSRPYFRIPIGCAGLVLGLYPKRSRGTIFEQLEFSSILDIHWRTFYLTIASGLLIIAILLSPMVARVLSSRILSTLGKYTFSLYLTHLLVIYTVSTSVVIALAESIGYVESVLVAAAVSLPAFIVVSFLFEKLIDAPAIRFSKQVGRAFRGESEPKPVSAADAPAAS